MTVFIIPMRQWRTSIRNSPQKKVFGWIRSCEGLRISRPKAISPSDRFRGQQRNRIHVLVHGRKNHAFEILRAGFHELSSSESHSIYGITYIIFYIIVVRASHQDYHLIPSVTSDHVIFQNKPSYSIYVNQQLQPIKRVLNSKLQSQRPGEWTKYAWWSASLPFWEKEAKVKHGLKAPASTGSLFFSFFLHT